MDDQPVDPFLGDPDDPAHELDALDDPADDPVEPLSLAEREEVLSDLTDLEVFRELLEPQRRARAGRGLPGVRGDALLRLGPAARQPRHLLDLGRTRVHEPAYSPDPDQYVTWDYARGYADAVCDVTHDHDDD